MVDVGEKPITHRRAVAEAVISVNAATLELIESNTLAKGDVISTARLAGIMAAKSTPQLIPLCHSLELSSVDVKATIQTTPPAIILIAEARCQGRTGVEMEAMTAVSIAALTVYDMAKAVERGIEIQSIRLIEKEGGKTGHWSRNSES